MNLNELIRERGRLLSLIDLVELMKDLDLDSVCCMMEIIGRMHERTAQEKDFLDISLVHALRDNLPPFTSFCEKMDMVSTLAAANRLKIAIIVFEAAKKELLGLDGTERTEEYRKAESAAFEDLAGCSKDIYKHLEEVNTAFDDETFSDHAPKRKFLFLEAGNTRIFENPLADWVERVKQSMPDAMKFIDQSCRCQAIGMPAAALYFLICAIEFGLYRLEKNVPGLNLPPAGKETWGEWIKVFDIYAVKVRSRDGLGRHIWKKPPFYDVVSEVRKQLNSIKDTRDYVGHPALRPLEAPNWDGDITSVSSAARSILMAVATTCRRPRT